MIRILIADENSSHAGDIKTAIAAAYGGGGVEPIEDQIQVVSTWEAAVTEAESNDDIIALLRSYTGVEAIVSDAEALYPRVQCFFPLGTNFFMYLDALTSIPVVVTSGAGDTEYENKNNTGWGPGLEFWDNDLTQSSGGDASSFSNGYVLGKLLKIKDTLDCSWWEARYRARMTADRPEDNRETWFWDLRNGYGIINVAAAIGFDGDIPDDPYQPAPVPDAIKGVQLNEDTRYGAATFHRVTKARVEGSRLYYDLGVYQNEAAFNASKAAMENNDGNVELSVELKNLVYTDLMKLGGPLHGGTIIYE